MAEPFTPMQTHRTPDVALWDHWRALREQWTHEDNLIAQRMGWLIWSEGLMFTAYGAHARDGVYWLLLDGEAGLADLCALAPASHIANRGRWAAKAMPFVFGAMWLLALLGRLHD